ncbi:hypothetical protein FBEOM_5085 [Fusarium beomiforme]|uniref:Uncharacterized protein n=1 Tax=Fusarium beomiforme TaxID=44412 RepID=A0A9P5ALZ4_9HYPO|nr:hypothetical protein FBEOM_5085 [Fusarium beomiforme]
MGSGRNRSSRGSSSKGVLAECQIKKCDHVVAHFKTSNEDSVYCTNRCPASTRSKQKFCSIHSECSWPECHAKLLDVEGDKFQYSDIDHANWLCRDHSCKAQDKGKQCYKIRVGNLQYCPDHAKEFQCHFKDCDSDHDDTSSYWVERDDSAVYINVASVPTPASHVFNTLRWMPAEIRHFTVRFMASASFYTVVMLLLRETPASALSISVSKPTVSSPGMFFTTPIRNGAICTAVPPKDALTTPIIMLGNAPDIPVKSQIAVRWWKTVIPTRNSAKAMPAPTSHVTTSPRYSEGIALIMHARLMAAVPIEISILHILHPSADIMGRKDWKNKNSTIFAPQLLLELPRARVVEGVGVSMDEYQGHMLIRYFSSKHFGIRFRLRKWKLGLMRWI